MNVVILALVAVPLFWAAYRFYGRFLAKVFDVNDANQTPAYLLQDGVDYIPTSKGVVFSHHFASIAGAGPIVGPTVAMIYGYLPAYLWVLMGAVFIGAVHDYTAVMVSLREQGKSMAEVAKTSLGKSGFFLFIGFTIAMIVLVTSAFLGLTATALSSLVPVAKLQMSGGVGWLHTVTKDGVEMAQIGGIASTSVIVMTLCAPLLGYFLYIRKVNTKIMGLFALAVGIISILIGLIFPISFNPATWQIILTIYVFIAAGIPVWMLLQPRDFTNSFILYFGIAALLIGVVGGGLSGVELQAPATNLAEGMKKAGMIWPFLFITIACGAISGFHSLVAGGTVAKQVQKESDAKIIGYGGMLLEGLLAVVVIAAVAGGLDFETYKNIVYPVDPNVKSNPILAFSLGMGGLLHQSLGLPLYLGTIFGILMVEGFVITTLDTAVRLNRYLFEELWNTLFKQPPAWIKSYYFNAGLSVAIMFYLAYTNKFLAIWPIFGSANQLLAAISLLAVSAWLYKKGKPIGFTLLPAIFMFITTIYALWNLLTTKYLAKGISALAITDIILLIFSIGVAVLAAKLFLTPADANRNISK